MLSLLLSLAAVQAAQVDEPGIWERSSLLGDAGGVRPALAEVGLTTTLEFTGEVISNVSGGLRRDTGADLLLDWIIDADLRKALGWTGASAHLNPMWLAGDGITDDVGDLTVSSNITGRGGVRVYEAWLQQSFLDGELSLRGGVLAADQEFAVCPTGSLFYNSVFGGPVFLTPNVPWPIYPVGALGARVRVDPAKNVYVQAAIYDGDPGSEEENRSGFHVRLNGVEGYFVIAEAGRIFDEPERGALKVGVFHHHGSFVESPSGKPRDGLTGAYALLERGLAPGIDAFLRLGYSQENVSVVSIGLDTGVTFKGLLPGRPEDVLGLGVIYARISEDFAEGQPDTSKWGHETVLEATYKLVFAPWWNLQPDLQYIVHPGGSTSTRNATVVAIRIDVFF